MLLCPREVIMLCPRSGGWMPPVLCTVPLYSTIDSRNFLSIVDLTCPIWFSGFDYRVTATNRVHHSDTQIQKIVSKTNRYQILLQKVRFENGIPHTFYKGRTHTKAPAAHLMAVLQILLDSLDNMIFIPSINLQHTSTKKYDRSKHIIIHK